MPPASWPSAGAMPPPPAMPETDRGGALTAAGPPAPVPIVPAADGQAAAPALPPADGQVIAPASLPADVHASARAVVITRPRRQAGALAAAVAARGRTPVILPLLEIEPVDDQAGLARRLAQLGEYALVAFVSPNAVDAAFAHIDRWPEGVAIAVVGEGSRAALLAHGIDQRRVTIHCPRDPARSDSEQLLQALDLAVLAGRRVLVVRGDGGRELLPDALRGAGCAVETVAAYRRALPTLDAALAASLRSLLTRPNDWILTSSEALRGLVALVGQLDDGASVASLQRQHLIVPHARIADTARALGFVAVTLTGSGDERLLAALQS
jgi:uroporphyrinogen-III synthase